MRIHEEEAARKGLPNERLSLCLHLIIRQDTSVHYSGCMAPRGSAIGELTLESRDIGIFSARNGGKSKTHLAWCKDEDIDDDLLFYDSTRTV
jgi:hypothetical protein